MATQILMCDSNGITVWDNDTIRCTEWIFVDASSFQSPLAELGNLSAGETASLIAVSAALFAACWTVRMVARSVFSSSD
jgi:hypothetical protein